MLAFDRWLRCRSRPRVPSGRVLLARRVFAFALVAVCGTARPLHAAEEMASLPEPPPPCPFDGENREWTQRALHGWQRVNHNALKIARPVPPAMVLFDAKCSFTLKPAPDDTQASTLTAGGFRYAVTGVPHEGMVALPDGQTAPAQLTSFAAPLPDGTMAFVMALPPIWIAQAKGNDRALLATAVFMHEFTHTQSPGFGRRIDALVKRGLPADVDDDVIQSRFASRPGFAASFKREQEMLWQAAAAANIKDARALSKRALRVIDNRRERYFKGPDAVYAPAEDLFLTLEGTGQYALYRWLTDPEGGGMAKPDALAFARRDGKRWSQDQGLALYLVLDRLWIDWPPATFGPQQQTVLEALRAAVEPARK